MESVFKRRSGIFGERTGSKRRLQNGVSATLLLQQLTYLGLPQFVGWPGAGEE